MEEKKEERKGVMITSQSEKIKRWSRRKNSCCLNDYRIDYSSRIF